MGPTPLSVSILYSVDKKFLKRSFIISLNCFGATFKLPPCKIEFLKVFIVFLYLERLANKTSTSFDLAPNLTNESINDFSFLNPGKTILPFLITSSVPFIKLTIISFIIFGLSTASADFLVA